MEAGLIAREMERFPFQMTRDRRRVQAALARSEPANVGDLFAQSTDAAMENTARGSDLYRRLESAARIIVERFLPDLPEL